MYCHQCLHYESDETQIVHRCLAWSMQKYASVGGEAPVVVLAATVDTLERFFVQKATETMLACHLLHQCHDEHVVVYGKVHLLKDGCQLKLIWCHLVVTCLAWYAQFECLNLQVFHKGNHACRDRTEIMVVHLLVLGRIVSH